MSTCVLVSLTGIASLVLTWIVRALCVRQAWLSTAVGSRLEHPPTPRFGGIAIGSAMALACLFSNVWKEPHLLLLLGPAFGIFLLGLADDVWQLSPKTKLAFQLVLAVVPAAAGFVLPITHLKLVDQAITVFWFVSLTNAFNLLDNMNGLAAGTAIIVACFRGLIAYHQDDRIGLLLCLCLASAVAGFLVFNFPKGLIFMGDSGALFLGFTLASFAFTGTHAYIKSYLDALVFPVLMLLPICDTTFVTIVRCLCGRPISQGGKDHLSHSLLGFGLSASMSVVLLWIITAVCGAVSLAAAIFGSARTLTLVIILLATMITIVVNLARYQLAVSGMLSEMLARKSPGGIALTLGFDLLLAVSAYYSACLLTFTKISEAQKFFWHSGFVVIATQSVAMLLIGCYPRLPVMRAHRMLQIAAACAVGACVAFAAGLFLGPEIHPEVSLLYFVLAAVLIVIYRWFHQIVESHCVLLESYAQNGSD